MKVEIGDYIKTEYGPRLVVDLKNKGCVLENGEMRNFSELQESDVLLESEVV